MSLWSTRTAITLRGVLAGVLIGGLVAGGVAAASVSFDDVPSGKFYEAPVEWAKANNITTGSPAGSRTFKPEDPVTRGESVTFLKRYDDNIVQPALANKADAADTYTKAEVDAAIPTVYWIWVKGSDGSKIDGTAGVTSTRNATGSYTVDFGGVDIRACSWSATPRLPGGVYIVNSTDATVTLFQATSGLINPVDIPDQIVINTYDESGVVYDISVQLQVICP